MVISTLVKTQCFPVLPFWENLGSGSDILNFTLWFLQVQVWAKFFQSLNTLGLGVLSHLPFCHWPLAFSCTEVGNTSNDLYTILIAWIRYMSWNWDFQAWLCCINHECTLLVFAQFLPIWTIWFVLHWAFVWRSLHTLSVIRSKMLYQKSIFDF
jgi:hypothetical protein